MTSDRRTALLVAAAGGLAFLVLAVLLVPWDPVPGGALDPPDPRSVFTGVQIAEAEAYSRWARIWGWASLAVSLVVAVWLGFGAAGRRLVGRVPGPWWVRVVLAVAAVDLVGRLATLPFAVLAHRHRRDYGLSTQGWPGFLTDVAKGELVAVVTLSVVLLVLVGSARRWRTAWPVVASGVLGGLVLVGSFVFPVLVEPLFYDFRSLPEGPLRARILELADREQVRVDDVLVADASRRTTTLNAYVSGYGGTRRIVVYDTLVEGLPEDEALSVVAHELAHARNHDVVVGSALGVAGTVLGVGLLGAVSGGVGRRGRSTMADVGAVPLVWALVVLVGFVASPVQSGISRRIETRADVDALHAIEDSGAFARMQRQLALRSLSDPTPPAWSQFWFGSHPTTLERIALAEAIG